MNFLTRSRMTVTVMFALSFSAVARTQMQSQAPGAPPQGTVSQRSAPSVMMAVELSKSVDSKKAKTGDQVEAKTLQDMKAPNGTDIPRGSKVIGHVTQAAAHSKEQPQAQLGFVFEKIVTKSGQEFPLHGLLQAVSVPENAPPNAGGGFGPGSVGAQQGGPGGGGQQQPGMAGPAGSQSGGQPGMTGAAGGGNQGAPGASGDQTGAMPSASPATAGVTGLRDVQLSPGAEPALTSSSRNIHLDSGSLITVKVVPMPQPR